MKHNAIIMAAIMLVAACTKEVGQTEYAGAEKEICFNSGVVDINVGTKVTATTVDNMSSFQLLVTTGAEGSETESWSATATKSDGVRYITGRYWPAVNPQYHFYGANVTPTLASGRPVISADGSQDIVVAASRAPSFSEDNPMLFHHIYSMVGNVSVESNKGYTVSGVSVSIANAKTGGVYDIISSDWTSTTTVNSLPLNVGENSALVVSGTSQVSVTFTITKGDYTGTFTKTGNVVFPVGKICDLAVTISSDPAVIVAFAVSVSEWSSKQCSLNLL